MKRSQIVFTLLKLPLDFIAIWGGFLLAYFIRVRIELVEIKYLLPFDDFLTLSLYFAFACILIFIFLGLYRFRVPNLITEIANVFWGITVGVAFVIIGFFFLREPFFSRLIIIYGWALSFLFVIFGRYLIFNFKRWLFYYGTGINRVVLVGAGGAALEVAQDLKNYPSKGYQVIGYVSAHDEGGKLAAEGSFKRLGSFDELESVLKRFKIDEVIQTVNLPKKQAWGLITLLERLHVNYRFIPDLLDLYTTNFEIEQIAGRPIIHLSPTPLMGWNRVVKRTIDLVGSLIGLVILSPIFILIAILVKLDSKGPIIFSQKRVGLNNDFLFYKFRSMYAELSTGEGFGGEKAEKMLAELKAKHNEMDGPMFKMENDPRITKVGRFLRRTSLDELPQLFNVLVGDMSLVGPRPPLPVEVKEYGRSHLRRLLVKPGITGLWQVSGRNDLAFEEYVKLDISYIENWSLFLDISILWRTFLLVVSNKAGGK